MGRNLDHRVELLFPIESRALVSRLRDEILAIYLADHRNARRLGADEQYRWEKAEGGLNCQQRFLNG
jgi:polyphosphate kinase